MNGHKLPILVDQIGLNLTFILHFSMYLLSCITSVLLLFNKHYHIYVYSKIRWNYCLVVVSNRIHE